MIPKPQAPARPAAGLSETDRAEVALYLAGHELIKAARQGDWRQAEDLIDRQGADVNFEETLTGMTALHYAAAYDAIPLLRVLIRTGRCDYTIKDYQGRTASTLAFEAAGNPVTGRFLLKKEFQQLAGKGASPAG